MFLNKTQEVYQKMPSIPIKAVLMKKDGKILWYAWCVVCNKKLDSALDGSYIESYGTKHTEETGHTTLIGCMIVAVT